MESVFFTFDGIQSYEMGLYIVRIQHSGFVETPYFGATNIHEEKSSKRHVPHFYGVTREPIEFDLQFALMDKYLRPRKWTPEERFKIAKWLIHDTYKEFQSSDDLGKKYYAIITNPASLFTIGKEGYTELTLRTNSPFAWSPVYMAEHDLSNNTTSTIITMENRSNVSEIYNPLIEIELVGGATSVELKNLSNDGKIMKFEGLTPNETISIDTRNKIIKSNTFSSNPFSKFNIGGKKYWCDLVFGENSIEVKGKCKIWVKSQYPIAQ